MANQFQLVTINNSQSEIIEIAKKLGIKWVGVNKPELIIHVNGAISRVNRGKSA